MHKLIAASAILEHELSELRLLVERQAGMVLDCPNSALAAHVSEFIEAHNLESAAALLERVRSCDQDSALPQLLDGLLNSNTSFFRHPGALGALTRHVLPQLYARKASEGSSPLRIWSAGCATGEEAYSIAIAVCDAMASLKRPAAANGNANGTNSNGGTGESSNGKTRASRSGGIAETPVTATTQNTTQGWLVHIVGSDLLPSAIEAAERGVYPQSAVGGLPLATIRSCFSKVGSVNGSQNGSQAGPPFGASSGFTTGASASHLLVKPRLRSLVTFNTMNLARPGYIGRFDCIFCMDVLPHFSRAQRLALLERLHLYLEPGGYLFLGQTEKLAAPNLNFRSETFDGYTFHRKPLAASAAYGR
jgi:chemotaxis methyl-accepting protein methylase